MAEDLPPLKLPKLSSPVELTEFLWAKIFSYLPPKERFKISAVSRHWRDFSRIPLSDIKRLNLSDIPSSKINSILSLTSVVNKIIARKQKILLDEKAMPPILAHLESFKLYDVCFSAHASGSINRIARSYAGLLAEYFEALSRLSELVWHNVKGVDSRGTPYRALLYFPNTLGRSLRRLQLTYGLHTPVGAANLVPALNELEHLESLYLGGQGFLVSCVADVELRHTETFLTKFYEAVGRLQNLRELCLADVTFEFSSEDDDSYCDLDLSKVAAVACEKLRQLEVMMFAGDTEIAPSGISRLLTDHPTLKILVITGASERLQRAHASDSNFTPVILPRRNSLSRPCLQVFVGGPILRYVRFTPPQTGAAVFTEIDCPMPQFLTKPEVAEVFKEVWTAKMIREGAQNGVAACGSPNFGHIFYSTDSLRFHYGD